MGLFGMFNNKVITPEERRKKTIEKLREQGVMVNEHFSLLESVEEVTFKSEDEIMKRIIAAFTAIQVACSINNGENYEESVNIMLDVMKKCKGNESDFLDKERRIMENNFSKQDVIDVAWTYECVFMLLWAVGYKADKYDLDASNICNVDMVIYEIKNIMNDIACKPKLIKKEKIMDALDLFYCYHWACVEKQIHPETPIGNLNHSVVVERRRALEWLISDEADWFDIQLHT